MKLSLIAIAALFFCRNVHADDAFNRDTVIFIGSSTMAHWQPRIGADFAPLSIWDFGANGTDFHYLEDSLPDWMAKFPAKRWVIYSGDNDLYENPPRTPDQIDQDMVKTVSLIHGQIPDSEIFVLSIKCRISDEADCPRVVETNKLLAAAIGKMKHVTSVDTYDAMLASGGDIHRFFDDDGIHLSAAGYDLWRDTLKPILLKSIAQSAGPSAASLAK
jgi:hypothetical protein